MNKVALYIVSAILFAFFIGMPVDPVIDPVLFLGFLVTVYIVYLGLRSSVSLFRYLWRKK